VEKGEEMKKLLLVLLLVTNSAWAEWVKISETEDAVFYIDPTTLRKSGNLRRIWAFEDIKKSIDGMLSSRSRDEYDCKNERHRSLAFSAYSASMLKGKTLGSSDSETEWQDIPPNTPRETTLRFVCSR
jgi:hypothetical protein